MSIFIPEEITKKFGDTSYLIRALPAEYGLEVLRTLSEVENPTPKFMKEVIFKSVTVNNMQPTDEWFNKHFSRNYKELHDLFATIVEFNFGSGEEDSPNAEGGTSGE